MDWLKRKLFKMFYPKEMVQVQDIYDKIKLRIWSLELRLSALYVERYTSSVQQFILCTRTQLHNLVELRDFIETYRNGVALRETPLPDQCFHMVLTDGKDPLN